MDNIVARVFANEVVIRTQPAAQGLIAACQVEEVSARSATHLGFRRAVRHNPRLINRQRVGNAANIKRDANILERRDDHLQDECLINPHGRPEQIAAARGLIIGVNLPEDFIPISQIVKYRVVRV